MGCQQCLPLSVVQLKGKHCRKPHCHNGVVDTFGQWWLTAILEEEHQRNGIRMTTKTLALSYCFWRYWPGYCCWQCWRPPWQMEFSCSTFGRFGARSTGSCYSNEFISMQWTAELDPWWGVYPWQGRRKWGGRWGNRTPTFPFPIFLTKDLDYFKLPISLDLPTALHDEGCCAHLAVLEGKG